MGSDEIWVITLSGLAVLTSHPDCYQTQESKAKLCPGPGKASLWILEPQTLDKENASHIHYYILNSFFYYQGKINYLCTDHKSKCLIAQFETAG
jgi:hypothetical protein